MKAVYDWLRVELNNKPTKEIVDYWLEKYLNDNDWWICKGEATEICLRLRMNTDNIGLPTYYESIKVWIPEEMWGIEAMPFYPTCRNNRRVVIDGFEHKYFGRVIVDLCDTYFVMGRRYKCNHCEEQKIAIKEELQLSAAATVSTVWKVNINIPSEGGMWVHCHTSHVAMATNFLRSSLTNQDLKKDCWYDVPTFWQGVSSVGIVGFISWDALEAIYSAVVETRERYYS